jgi:hypothetical protein
VGAGDGVGNVGSVSSGTLRMRKGGRRGKTNSSGWEGGGVEGVDQGGSAQSGGTKVIQAC